MTHSVLDLDALIPHRPPFRYVDRVVAVDETSILAEWRVGESEPFVAGHYPGNPILPAVLQCEALFQTGALLLGHLLLAEAKDLAAHDAAAGSGRTVPIISRIRDAKFRRMVRPGELLTLKVTLHERVARAFEMIGVASVDGQKAAVVRFLAAAVEAPSPG